MQFIREDDVFKVARITGPSHNFLGIRLCESEQPIKITPLPIKKGETAHIEGHDVLAQVENGLIQINKIVKTKYFLSEVQFVPSDTASTSIYEYLIQELIARIDSNDDFAVI